MTSKLLSVAQGGFRKPPPSHAFRAITTPHFWRSKTLPPHHSPRQQRNAQHGAQRNTPSQIQHPLRTSRVRGDPSGRQERLRRERRDDAEQAAPERRETRARTADGRREDLGRPAVEDGVEHGLEETVERRGLGMGGIGFGRKGKGGAYYSIMLRPMLAGCVLTAEKTKMETAMRAAEMSMVICRPRTGTLYIIEPRTTATMPGV